MRSLICLFLLALTAGAADFSGKWAGTAEIVSPDGSTQQFSVMLELRQSGAALAGRISASEGEADIANAAVEGNTVRFEVQQGDNGPLWQIRLTASGDELNGEASGHRGERVIKGRLKLHRAKTT